MAGPSTFLVFAGILLILAGSALNSFQNVIEELLMKMLVNYREPHPLEIVGWEGVYGTLLSAFVLLPAAYYIPGSDCGGRLENSLDTLYQLRSPAVLFLVLCYVAALGYMNYSSMELSRLLSAVVRNHQCHGDGVWTFHCNRSATLACAVYPSAPPPSASSLRDRRTPSHHQTLCDDTPQSPAPPDYQCQSP